MLNHHGDDGEYCQYDDDGNSHLRLLIRCHCSPPSFAGQGCLDEQSSSSHMQQGIMSPHAGYCLTMHSCPKHIIRFPPLLLLFLPKCITM